MTKALTLVDDPAANDKLLAKQLSDQYHKAISGLWEVTVFGAMMMALRGDLLARPSADSDDGRSREHGGLDGWLSQFCPDISRPTAYRFMAIAEGLQEEFKLGRKVNLHELLTTPIEKLDAKLAAKRRDIAAFLEGKSQRQLLFYFANPDPKPLGGARPHPEHEPDYRRALEEKRWRDVAITIQKFGIDKQQWSHLLQHDIQLLYEVVSEFYRALKKVVRPS